MATSVGTPIPTENFDVGQLAQLFLGKSGSSNSSTTSTTKSNLTDEGAQELINQMLQGTSGLSAIANAGHAAGLYGGSTQTLLTNNLLSQTAAKVAAAQAGTTTTSNTSGGTKTNPQINPLAALGGVAGASLLNAILQGTTGQGISGLLGSAGGGIANLLKGLTGGGSGDGSGAGSDGVIPAPATGNLTLPSIDDSSNGIGNLGANTTTIPIGDLFPDNSSASGSGFGSSGGYDYGGNTYSNNSDEDDNTPDLSSYDNGGNP